MTFGAASQQPVLSVRDLHVALHTQARTVYPVRGVSFDVARGETLAIVGESGSGKTVLNLAPLGLLPSAVSADLTGSVLVGDSQLVGSGANALTRLRGRRVGVIFQDPLSALNPARRIGPQLTEGIELHLGMPGQAARRRATDLLRLVGLAEPAAIMNRFPHEVSGGMRQRVTIAIAIAAEPEVLIADEPTTALDVTIQAQILDLLRSLQARLSMAIVLVTHDIGVVAGMADRVAVMYAGRFVETGTAVQVLTVPVHPYTRSLLASLPGNVRRQFRSLPGSPPDLGQVQPGCAFAPRCAEAEQRCTRDKPVLAMSESIPGQACACLLRPSARIPGAMAHV